MYGLSVSGRGPNGLLRAIIMINLATAFEHGSFSLEAKPNPALLALPDPYDPSARAGINYPKDFSLYKGRYYLYFGPVPALILAIFKRYGFKQAWRSVYRFCIRFGNIHIPISADLKDMEAFFPEHSRLDTLDVHPVWRFDISLYVDLNPSKNLRGGSIQRTVLFSCGILFCYHCIGAKIYCAKKFLLFYRRHFVGASYRFKTYPNPANWFCNHHNGIFHHQNVSPNQRVVQSHFCNGAY